MTATYLPADALMWLKGLFQKSPGWTVSGVFLLFVVITGLFRWQSQEGPWPGLLLMALFATLALVFISACLYLLTLHHGYRFIL